MASISESVERELQRVIARNKGKIIDEAVVYAFCYPYETIRYVDGSKHLTGSWGFEFLEEPWYHWHSRIARELFAPKGVVVHFSAPACWDNEVQSLPEDELKMIFRRIERSFGKRYKRCRFVVDPPRKAKEIA
jgi:hypothetical protein